MGGITAFFCHPAAGTLLSDDPEGCRRGLGQVGQPSHPRPSHHTQGPSCARPTTTCVPPVPCVLHPSHAGLIMFMLHPLRVLQPPGASSTHYTRVPPLARTLHPSPALPINHNRPPAIKCIPQPPGPGSGTAQTSPVPWEGAGGAQRMARLLLALHGARETSSLLKPPGVLLMLPL